MTLLSFHTHQLLSRSTLNLFSVKPGQVMAPARVGSVIRPIPVERKNLPAIREVSREILNIAGDRYEKRFFDPVGKLIETPISGFQWRAQAHYRNGSHSIHLHQAQPGKNNPRIRRSITLAQNGQCHEITVGRQTEDHKVGMRVEIRLPEDLEMEPLAVVSLVATPMALRSVLESLPKKVIPLETEDIIAYVMVGEEGLRDLKNQSFREEMQFLFSMGAALQAGGMAESEWLGCLQWHIAYLKGMEGYAHTSGIFSGDDFAAVTLPDGWERSDNRDFWISTEQRVGLHGQEASIFAFGFNENAGMPYVENGQVMFQMHLSGGDIAVPVWFLNLWEKFATYIEKAEV